MGSDSHWEKMTDVFLSSSIFPIAAPFVLLPSSTSTENFVKLTK